MKIKYLFVRPSVRPSVCLSICTPVRSSARPPVCPSTCHPFVCLSMHGILLANEIYGLYILNVFTPEIYRTYVPR